LPYEENEDKKNEKTGFGINFFNYHLEERGGKMQILLIILIVLLAVFAFPLLIVLFFISVLFAVIKKL
jgi:flagellar basal body-associated protein FliL